MCRGLQGFKFPTPGFPPQSRIDLNSNFREPGTNSYMRETVGYALMRRVQGASGPPELSLCCMHRATGHATERQKHMSKANAICKKPNCLETSLKHQLFPGALCCRLEDRPGPCSS